MKSLLFALLPLFTLTACQLFRGATSSTAPSLKELSSNITEHDLKRHVYYLASKKMKGRDTGSAQEVVYQKHYAHQFEQMGLRPAGDKKSYLQKFDLVLGVELGKNNWLKVNRKKYKVGNDWMPASFSKLGKIKTRDVVFVGYGIKAPKHKDFKAYNSYVGAKVKGKWAMAFRYLPEKLDGKYKTHLNRYAKIQYKAMVAKEYGAKGLIIVSGPNAHAKSDLMKLRYEGGVSNFSVSVISVTDKLAQKMLGNKKLKSLQDRLDVGAPVKDFKLPKIRVAANVAIKHRNGTAHNVLALLKVKGARSTVMIGAHGDHLGKGKKGNSLMTKDDVTDIHFGADDNASGVSGVMEIAHYLAAYNKEHPGKLKKNFLFAIWSGEEIGLLGSNHFVESWKKRHHYSLEDSLLAYLNMDMIGRYRDILQVQGSGSSKKWKDLISELSKKSSLKIQTEMDPYVPSDGMNFYIGKVPTLTFFTGSHSEYHTPRDKADTLNYAGMVDVVTLVKDLAVKLGSENISIPYHKVKGEKKTSNRGSRKFRVYLGTIPAYMGAGKGKTKGVPLSGAKPGSPAEQAGIQKGDILVELNGKELENIYDFVYALQMLTPKVKTSMSVLRNGKKLKLHVVPLPKE